jgi:L,D-transpeptidase ErfK/SrfK
MNNKTYSSKQMVVCRFFERLAAFIIMLGCCSIGHAELYKLPHSHDDVIGNNQEVYGNKGDTLSLIAMRHGIGFNEIKLANPAIDLNVSVEGVRIVLPTRYVLPDAPRDGIIVNIPEMRLYCFCAKESGISGSDVYAFPINIGMDKYPTGKTYISSIINREESSSSGIGGVLIKLKADGFSIRDNMGSSHKEMGAREHGKGISMKKNDLALLSNIVAIGMPVYLVDQPIKLGWLNGALYLELMKPLNEDSGIPNEHRDENIGRAFVEYEDKKTKSFLMRLFEHEVSRKGANIPVDMEAVNQAIDRPTGIPLIISDSGLSESHRSERYSGSLSEKRKLQARQTYNTSDFSEKNDQLRKGQDMREEKISMESGVVRITAGDRVGSGFFVEKETVFTNAHVVGNSPVVKLSLSNGKTFSGRTVYFSRDLDFAIIATNQSGSPLNLSSKVQSFGDAVAAIGFPQGRNVVALSTGTIIDITDCCIIHDALAAAGSSGGPLMNNLNQVIGLNTMLHKMPWDTKNETDRTIAVSIKFIYQQMKMPTTK